MGEKRQVAAVAERDIDDLRLESLRVTSLQVDQTIPGRPSLILTIGFQMFGEPDAKSHSFALSPPAADCLSRDLQQAVNHYLGRDEDLGTG